MSGEPPSSNCFQHFEASCHDPTSLPTPYPTLDEDLDGDRDETGITPSPRPGPSRALQIKVWSSVWWSWLYKSPFLPVWTVLPLPLRDWHSGSTLVCRSGWSVSFRWGLKEVGGAISGQAGVLMPSVEGRYGYSEPVTQLWLLAHFCAEAGVGIGLFLALLCTAGTILWHLQEQVETGLPVFKYQLCHSLAI